VSVRKEDVFIDWPELTEHKMYAENFLVTWFRCSL